MLQQLSRIQPSYRQRGILGDRPQSRPNHDRILLGSTRRRRCLTPHTSPHGDQPQPLIQGGAIFRGLANRYSPISETTASGVERFYGERGARDWFDGAATRSPALAAAPRSS